MAQTKLREEQIEALSGGIGDIFYLNNTTTDIQEDSAFMKTLTAQKDAAGASSASTGSTVGSGETKHLIFATLPQRPYVQTITRGTFRFYITSKQTAGTRICYVFVKLYKQDTSGTQTLLVESSRSTALTANYVTYELTVSGGPFTFNRSDRLIAKIYYYGESSGTTATISSQWANTDGERIEIPFSNDRDNLSYADSGWIPIADTWTRTGNYTFTVSGDLTAYYRKGTKVRYKDGSTYEYGTVISSTYGAPNTTVTLATNSDYAMAAATITDTYISYIENPDGFPLSFNFTPSWTNVTVGNATQVAKFTIEHGMCFGNVSFKWASAGVTSAFTGSVILNAPVPINSALVAYTTHGEAACVDWGTALYMGETVNGGGILEIRAINAAGTYAVWANVTGTVPFTWAADDLLTVKFSYLI